MRKISALLAMVLVVAFVAVAWAENYSVSATFWRVTDIWETHTAEGVLIGREFELSCGRKPLYVTFSPSNSEWAEAKKVEKNSWLWLNTLPGNKAIIYFGVVPSAQMELGNILD